MGSSVSKPIQPPPPPPPPPFSIPDPMDLVEIINSKPPTFQEIAAAGASGNVDSAAAKTLQLAVSDPSLFSPSNLTNMFKNVTGLGKLFSKRSYGRRIKKQSSRKKKINRRSRKL